MFELRLCAARLVWGVCLASLLLVSAGCGNSAESLPSPTPSPSPTIHLTPTPTRPTPTPRPTATPTPPPVRLLFADQTVRDDGKIVVQQVTSRLSGWLVLTETGQTEVLTMAPVAAGVSDNITLLADPLALPEQATLTLFTDAGEIGQFEPGVDSPIQESGQPVAADVRLDLQITRPRLVVADQAVGEDGRLTLDSALLLSPGWVVIYADQAGALGQQVGFTYLAAGESRSVNVSIRWRQATPRLYAVLHRDTDRPMRFDYPQNDPPLRVQGQIVETAFRATFPPDVVVLNQPIINDQITVERVISDGPGWIAVSYQLDEDTQGNIIGFAHLEDGINGPVAITILTDLATPKLFLQLHRDTGDLGEFGFPGGDPVVLLAGRQKLFTVDTTSGNYLISQDQAPVTDDDQTTVTLPYTVSDISMWVVIRADKAGQPGAVLGQALVGPGINRGIVIPIDLARATSLLHAVLHVDNGEAGVFEFVENDQLDYELLRFRQIIDAPFALISAESP